MSADTAYSGTPLPRKLGLVTAKVGVGQVCVLGEPKGFVAALGELPSDVTVVVRLVVATRQELMNALWDLLLGLPREVHVWIIHPKAHRKPDFNQNDVRDAALAVGLVDYKVCSVDGDWSGLKFAWRAKTK